MNEQSPSNQVNWPITWVMTAVLGGTATGVGVFGGDSLKQAVVPAAFAQEIKELKEGLAEEKLEFKTHQQMTNYRLNGLEKAIPDIKDAVYTAKSVANETKTLQGRMETQLMHMKEIMQGQNQALAEIVANSRTP